MTTTRLCLIRHGETAWNSEQRLQGHTDIPLNVKGERQARQMAQALKDAEVTFDALYTSDLKRAADTANAVVELFAVKAQVDSSLRERHFGALQGLSISEAPALRPDLWQAHITRDLDHELEGGESIQQLATRVQQILDWIQEQHAGKTVVIVSHGGTIDMMFRIASNQALNTERVASVPNASFNWITYQQDSGWSVEQWGDTRHLEGPALENVDL
ncbi:histidine phosphatase family protein [Polynucleobacter sp. CS-Odin-A6]|uniref:histidine phosphatase family protein n=1 Tax=Polynucleobacter sp. CS-Odin-A6 TaxID=2689106 RepID=UPI001C0DD83F|nr:histidine phosphatase family protein [Polynucleobacter sp. CS-Odin-A6]MBU3620014.1 histidine phosphatase family protein [Polynucleobacter sp. CS-Odin-A6]